MASIKLKHSGGNGVIIAAPSSNPASDKTLTLPSDVDGTVVSKDSSNSLQNITGINGGQLGNRNLIINGGMICSQRGSSFASITNAFCLDRFKFRNNNGISGTFTVSQSTDTPDGFGNSLKVDVGTADAAIAAAEVMWIGYKFEGQDLQQLAKGTSGAKKSVLSFYVKTNKTGQYSVLLHDNDNSRMFSTSYTVSNTNWNRYTIDVAADTTGAYGNDNASSLEIYWYLGAGSDRTSGTLTNAWAAYADANVAAGQVNFADSTSNEFYITGIQYEVNESGVATEFEHKSFGQELALAKRYYQQYPQNPADAYGPIGVGRIRSGTNAQVVLTFPEMRSSPSVAKSGNLRVLHAATATVVNSVAGSHLARTTVFIEPIVSSGLAQGEGCILTADNDSSGKVTLTAEL